MFNMISQGGTFMYIILGVSIIALALFFERASYLYFRLKLNMDKAFFGIMKALEKANYSDALKECSKIENHPLGRILKAGLIKSDKKDKDIERAMEEKILREIPRIKARINLLTLFANISTLLGLLGTIQGLMLSFKSVSSASEAMKQEVLASGISVAMLTTAFGLIVAIPCLIAYYVLNNRGEFIIDQFEEKALSLANSLSTLKKDGSI
ncbi:MAG: MotA/TolQ/ExbB proton channel family protein [Desulfatiglans sp.]|nr:MotA/TolQ/ExbB proton channel family protein [Desulfatiglans sp.]